MTTNNHPAHGPVSLKRLHQISEILSKATAQSDGGNLGYAMADAVKVIDGAIAAFGAEPAPVDIEMLATVLRNAPLAPSDSQGKPRAPVVPDEDPRDAFERTFKMPKHVTRCGTGYAVTAYSAWLAHDFVRMWEGWNACRAAMLQGTDGKPELTVWYGSMPETNGKTNWTAMLHRKGQHQWEGITIDRSEYPDRVRYEADRMRHLIGELPDEPDILSYDADAHSGYVKPGNSPASPDGWQLVPKKITLEMECAISRADSYEIGWQWALAAAPKYEVKS